MTRRVLWSVPIVCTLAAASWPVHAEQTDSLRALVVTGQNNHGWQVLSDHYETILKEPASSIWTCRRARRPAPT